MEANNGIVKINQDYFTEIKLRSGQLSCILHQGNDTIAVQYEYIPEMCKQLTKLHSKWLRTSQDS